MLFGISTMSLYFYLLSILDHVTLKDSKNYLIILGFLFICAAVEIVSEIKFLPKLMLRGFKWSIVNIKLARIKKKIKKNKTLSKREKEYLENKGKK